MKHIAIIAALVAGFLMAANASAGSRGGQFGGGHAMGRSHAGGSHHHHGHGHGAVWIGAVPFWWGYGYSGYAYPYYPINQPPPPQAYISKDDPYPVWFYCDNPQGYFPTVADCPDGWRTIESTPPAQ